MLVVCVDYFYGQDNMGHRSIALANIHLMDIITCFPYIADLDARVLILGSMPGVESLRMQQYYAHPRNAFWYIMSELLHFNPDINYEEKTGLLIQNKIALWDVLQACIRKGSLDSSIDKSSIVTNDFKLFFSEHPEIRHVFFNGKKSEQEYRKQVLAGISEDYEYLQYHSLPSTSPAMASLSREEKLSQWSVICKYI